MSHLEVINGLIRKYAFLPHRKTLDCAPALWEELKAALPQAESRAPWEPDLTWLTGVEVHLDPACEPGWWKLTRHDACEVTGGDDTDMPMAVSHEHCTVLAESSPRRLL